LAKATPIPASSRHKVRIRDQGRCARCGAPCDGQWHHRRSRSVRDLLTHSPANGLHLCATCHGWVHAHPFEARASGWIVSRYADPANEPVQHALYGEVYLTKEGGFTHVTTG
jgi:5-methylcytosine-specific restriction protein A